MRAVVQRVREARVSVDDEVVGEIGPGLCVLLGVGAGDGPGDADVLCRRIVGLRVFEDPSGHMTHDLRTVDGGLLVVSQFTLYGDCRKGRRPSFDRAAPPVAAETLYERFVAAARAHVPRVATGRFRARMTVALVNDGPVTLLLDTREAA